MIKDPSKPTRAYPERRNRKSSIMSLQRAERLFWGTVLSAAVVFCSALLVGRPTHAAKPEGRGPCHTGTVQVASFDDLAEALDDLRRDGIPCTLHVSGPIKIDADVAFPDYVQLWFTRGGALIADESEIRIEIRGSILAPEDQAIFRTAAGITCPRSDHPAAYPERYSCFRVRWTGQLLANWWDGEQISDSWNHMRASLNLRTTGVSSRSFKVVGKHVFSRGFDITGFRAPGGYSLHFGESHLVARADPDQPDGPALDMTNSRGLRVHDLRLAGDTEDAPNVGVLLARNSSGAAAGQHVFSGASVTGYWRVAALYNVESEVNHFIGGNYANDYPYGNYIIFLGRHIPEWDSVVSSYEDLVLQTSSATQQSLNNLRLTGFAAKGGIYVRSFSSVRINDVFVKNGGFGPQIVLDSSVHKIYGIEVARFASEGKAPSDDLIGIVPGKPESALRIFGRAVGGLSYDHISDGASEYAVKVESGEVLFSTFRINSELGFVCGAEVDMQQVGIELHARNSGLYDQQLKLGRRFVGDIAIGYVTDDAMPVKLEPAWDLMEATVQEFAVKATDGDNQGRRRVHMLESGAPTLTLESTDSGGAGTQARIQLENQASIAPYAWQIYGKGQSGQGELAVLNMRSGMDVITVRQNGHVGIGTEFPAHWLDVAGDVHATEVFADGRVVAAEFVTTSDASWKTAVRPLHDPLATLVKLRGVSFEWEHEPEGRGAPRRNLGFVAQEVDDVLPEVVSRPLAGPWGVAYGQIVPLLVEATKELHVEVQALRSQLEAAGEAAGERCTTVSE